MTKFPDRYNRPKIPLDATAADVRSIVDPIANEVEHDQNDLIDFYHYCRKRNRDFFHGMSLAEFKNWNDRRIAELEKQPPIETTDQARARIEATVAGMAGKWNPETKRLEFVKK